MNIGPIIIICGDEAISRLFAEALRPLDEKLNQLLKGNHCMAVTLNDLVAKVTALKSVDDGVVALLADIKAKLDAAIAANDPAAIQAISDMLDTESTRLAKAVTDNTPVSGGSTP